jgi:mannosyltransferase PIG-V
MNNENTTHKPRARGLYFSALALFAASRVVMLMALAFANQFLANNTSATTWDATPRWYRYLLRYDSGWYFGIAQHGYSYNGNDLVQQPVAFYPLYPIMIKALTVVGFSYAAAAVLVPNVAIVLAIVVLTRLISELYDDETAVISVALLSFFPASLFFSAGYTESLALLFIVCFFLYLIRGRFLVAACFAGLCFATRSTGLVLIAPLVWEIARRYWRADRRRFFLEGLVCLIIATAGLWLYMIYLWIAFRAPFAFMTAQAAWNVGNVFGNPLLLQPFVRAAADARYHVQHAILDLNSFSLALFLVFVAVIIAFRKQMSAPFLFFSAGVLLLPYFTRSGSVGFASFSRYIMLAFPVFIMMGSFCRRRVWLALVICGISGALLFYSTALFAKWYWVG